MNLRNLGETKEKKASNLKDYHEKALEYLASNKPQKGVTI